MPVQEILVESFTFWISMRAWCNVSEFENILLHLFVHTSWLPKPSSPHICSCCVHRMETHRSQLRFLDGAVSADLWTADSWTRNLSPTDSFRHKGVSLDSRLPMKIVRMLGGMPWCCNPPLLWCSSYALHALRHWPTIRECWLMYIEAIVNVLFECKLVRRVWHISRLVLIVRRQIQTEMNTEKNN